MRAMGIGLLALTLCLIRVKGITRDWGYHVEKFDESPGLYYVDKETVNL
jgi:hypothetical protein